ncbi:MAG: penicillin acylase family protein, partial [Catenulispora sp.]
MRWHKRPAIVGALCAALVAVALPGAAAVGDPADAAGQGPQIRRTEYGIPHILAQNYSDLGFGYGYAFAQDNACQMADRVLTLRGERSRYLGPTAKTNDALSGAVPNLDSDTYFQGQRRDGTVQRLLARPAPLGPTAQMRQLVDGYAAGFDRYLKEVGVAHLPDPQCQGRPWVQPITAEDVWANVLDIDQAASAAALRGEIATAAPPTGSSTGPATSSPTGPSTGPSPSAASPAAPAGSLSAALSALHSADRGSNGWALGADATAAHDGMLLANPHLPWNGNGRFYQVQLTIPGELDVSGAGLYGTPVVQIGHTAGLAWTHTSTDSDHFSLYRLQLVPGDPTSYLIDGRPEPMRRRPVPVQVLGADGTLTTVTRTLFDSRYGPVLADGWTTTSAIALRDADADNIRSQDQWLAMDRAQNVEQLRAAQRRYQGSPWVYTMAADTSGAAYFTDSSATPHLTDAQLAACTVAPAPGLPPLLNGATTACDWGTDADAVEPGLFGPGADPTLLRRDFVANSNNTPALTNPAAPLTGYPQVFGTSPRLDL